MLFHHSSALGSFPASLLFCILERAIFFAIVIRALSIVVGFILRLIDLLAVQELPVSSIRLRIAVPVVKERLYLLRFRFFLLLLILLQSIVVVFIQGEHSFKF